MSGHDPAKLAAAAFEAIFDNYPLVDTPRPLHESRLWALNSAYWLRRGPAAFTRDTVPYYVTSDGTLSVATAELLIGWAKTQAAGGRAVRRIALLELGPGSGLFGRIAARYYARALAKDPALPSLHYFGIDGSASMLDAIRQHGLIEADGVSVDLAVLDFGVDLDRLGAMVAATIPEGTPIFVVANYLLDSLPSTLLRRERGGIVEMLVEVRSRDARLGRLDGTHLLARQMPAACDQDDPMAHLAAPFLAQEASQIAINTGALRLLEALAAVIGANGAILINDYEAQAHEAGNLPWQHFAGSIATGLHFPSIEAFVTDTLRWSVVHPETPTASISGRLLLAHPDEALASDYRRLFSHGDAHRSQALMAAARRAQQDGRKGEALALYEAAVAAQPDNWSVTAEAAGFVLNALDEPQAAARLARLTLEGNPLSASAWNILGDCAYRKRDMPAAIDAYERASRVAGGDARALLNLAYCACMDERLEDALVWIARSLAVDANGGLTPEILRRQGEILARLPATPSDSK